MRVACGTRRIGTSAIPFQSTRTRKNVMEDQFSDPTFTEARKLIQTAVNSTYAMQHAKSVAIRKQLLEAAIQKVVESKTFYISDVRDIAAMNNRPLDSRSKLHEQLNILNCREFRRMRAGVLELLPLMIHRATGVPEERFNSLLEHGRAERPAASTEPVPALPATTPPALTAPAAVASAVPAMPAPETAVEEARRAVETPAEQRAVEPLVERRALQKLPVIDTPAEGRRWPLLASLALNAALVTALALALQGGRSQPARALPAAAAHPAGAAQKTASGPRYLVDSVLHTRSPADALAKLASVLPAERDGGNVRYQVMVQVEQMSN